MEHRPSHHGNGYKESDTMYNLNTVETHGVAYGIDRATFNMRCGFPVETSQAKAEKHRPSREARKIAQFGIMVKEESAPTVVAKGPGAVSHPIYTTSKSSYYYENPMLPTTEQAIVMLLISFL